MPKPGNPSEQTPLLPNLRNGDIYDRFTPAKKRVIVALVSWSGLIPLFVSGSFIPCIPQIARDLDTSAPVVSLAVSLSILTISLTSLVWATYSGFYGRRPVYLTSLPFLALGSIGVACARSVPALMAFRFIQAAGCSAGISVGSGTIADIFRLEERGTAMGIFFAAILLGPALAPVAGGFSAAYFTWRHMQFALSAAGVAAFLLVYFLLPETINPGDRGINKRMEGTCAVNDASMNRSRFVLLNPLRSLGLLRNPNLLAVTVVGTFALLANYVLLVPMHATFGRRYNIANEALLGACFLPSGLGNFIGAPLAGRMSDAIVIKYRRKRGGQWIPEDRLRATMLGAVALVPVSVLMSGFISQSVAGSKAALVWNLLCLFVNGLGVDFVLSPSAAYCVDVVHSRSAEVMAANNAFRGVLLSIITAGILPSIETIGVFSTNALAAIFMWFGALLMWMTIRYGDRMGAFTAVESP